VGIIGGLSTMGEEEEEEPREKKKKKGKIVNYKNTLDHHKVGHYLKQT